MTKISILGCGWLGSPLAKAMIAKGFSVNGSTTSTEKISRLKESGINPFLINITLNEDNSPFDKNISLEIETFLNGSSVLIIDIPPKLRGENTESFVDKIAFLIPFIEKSGVQKVIFVSSTSVYGDDFPIVEITEETQPNPDTESGKQLVIAETLLQSNPHFKTTVIRFGGLLGDDRHPVKFLAGRSNVENPEAPVNMIQREDCIGVIEKALDFARNDNWEWNQIFNAVAPQHPTRKAYYHKKAKILNLPLPTFAENSESKGKIISSEKVETILGYSFQKEI